ncbi:uncharacterized protein LOC115623603 [Scaptodrosophila lebanonensis]|uniref:Uncharacterized protein LOC115623603 n=1 Tax=Drosophila lebanonensis TaxID=7225 RepID=A0A6J2TEN7_DROLE|nr:uncharacterized protein LOC115623603 [Scaptodrosophila lebanonensis]
MGTAYSSRRSTPRYGYGCNRRSQQPYDNFPAKQYSHGPHLVRRKSRALGWIAFPADRNAAGPANCMPTISGRGGNPQPCCCAMPQTGWQDAAAMQCCCSPMPPFMMGDQYAEIQCCCYPPTDLAQQQFNSGFVYPTPAPHQSMDRSFCASGRKNSKARSFSSKRCKTKDKCAPCAYPLPAIACPYYPPGGNGASMGGEKVACAPSTQAQGVPPCSCDSERPPQNNVSFSSGASCAEPGRRGRCDNDSDRSGPHFAQTKAPIGRNIVVRTSINYEPNDELCSNTSSCTPRQSNRGGTRIIKCPYR